MHDAVPFPVEVYRKDYANDFTITASVCFTCNYRCSYCYNRTHEDKTQLDLERLLSFIKALVSKRKMTIDLYLIGGEPMLHPRVLQTARDFDALHCGGMCIYTNLSFPV